MIEADELCLDGVGHGWMAVAESVRAPSMSVFDRDDEDETEEGWDAMELDVEEQAFNGLGGDLKNESFKSSLIRSASAEKRKLAAERLGISPRTLRYKLAQMREHGIDLDSELSAA